MGRQRNVQRELTNQHVDRFFEALKRRLLNNDLTAGKIENQFTSESAKRLVKDFSLRSNFLAAVIEACHGVSEKKSRRGNDADLIKHIVDCALCRTLLDATCDALSFFAGPRS